jgi:hypothetical protein
MEEFCKIIKAAKRKGRYLVVKGIVPATDTGKRSWRFIGLWSNAEGFVEGLEGFERCLLPL